MNSDACPAIMNHIHYLFLLLPLLLPLFCLLFFASHGVHRICPGAAADGVLVTVAGHVARVRGNGFAVSGEVRVSTKTLPGKLESHVFIPNEKEQRMGAAEVRLGFAMEQFLLRSGSWCFFSTVVI